MKVSVIIPYHNEKSYIQDCLESLADQTFQDFEAIVVCDHCEEEAVEFLRGISVPFPIRILDMTDKTGVAAARNMGIRASQGELSAARDRMLSMEGADGHGMAERFIMRTDRNWTSRIHSPKRMRERNTRTEECRR